MKRLTWFALFILAGAAGFFGGEIRDALFPKPEPVYAQPVRADKGIRIALFNLEEAARQSKLFKARKILWEEAQTSLKEQNARMEQDYEDIMAEIQRARLANPDDTVLDKRVELRAIEEAMKVAKEEQQRYLGALLAQYQKEVLEVVMEELQKYVELQGYDIVLQDYADANADADFFSGAAYAQSLMSKSVLHAPGVIDKKNAYVTDITQAIIDRL